jgi:hypothetical protein
MSWTCGECRRTHGERETGNGGPEIEVEVNALCHHCGKPLCNRETDSGSCQFWVPDDAFSIEDDSLPVACHCRECAETHHSGARAESPREAALRKEQAA